MPMPGVYNEDVFKGLDLFLDELDQRGIRAIMVLNNYWEWTGGMGQYVSWGQGTKIPYRLAPGGDYNSFIQYVDRFYAGTTCQTMYRAHIQTIINRVNTVNGRTYRDDPTIFSWQLANEPRDYPKLTGDPPHETPGWFSVYDQDATTLAVISPHVSAVKP